MSEVESKGGSSSYRSRMNPSSFQHEKEHLENQKQTTQSAYEDVKTEPKVPLRNNTKSQTRGTWGQRASTSPGPGRGKTGDNPNTYNLNMNTNP